MMQMVQPKLNMRGGGLTVTNNHQTHGICQMLLNEGLDQKRYWSTNVQFCSGSNTSNRAAAGSPWRLLPCEKVKN